MISTSNSSQNWWLPRKGGRGSIALLVLLRVLGVRPSQQKMDGGRVLFIMWSMCKPHFLEMHIESLEILRLQVTLWNQYSIDTHSHVYTHVFIHTHTHVGATCPIRKMNSSQFPSCINHKFFFFNILMPWHLGACWCWKDCSFQELPIPRGSKQLGHGHDFQMWTNQSRAIPPATCLAGFSQLPLSPAPITPGPGTRQLGRSYTPEFTEIIQTSQS